MEPYQYHNGQREIQAEANTIPVADQLSSYVGPVADFCRIADLFILAGQDTGGNLHFAALSDIQNSVVLPTDPEQIKLGFNPVLFQYFQPGTACGGLAINLEEAKRARLHGVLDEEDGMACLSLQSALANCRKYIAPSSALAQEPHIGPVSVEALDLDDPRIPVTLAATETAFLATLTPEGMPDVSHRGGQPGFLRYDPSNQQIQWAEYLGDGMFLSMGNVRQLGQFALLAIELSTGDGLALRGTGAYTNVRRERKERLAGLLQDQEPFPVQGVMQGTITHADWLSGLCHPRQASVKAAKVTSRSEFEDQWKE